LNAALADTPALCLKTKNFYWHVSGLSGTYHLLFDEQSAQIFNITDNIAESARKIGSTTIRSIVARLQPIAAAMTTMSLIDINAELRDDNFRLIASMREAHNLCNESNNVATASLLENWIDEAGRRIVPA
jgi:starvation-inducible DNA-binding protein